MPTIIDLGRKVKAKYPGQYEDLDDGDLGRRVKAKFPGSYDDFSDENPTPLGTKQPDNTPSIAKAPIPEDLQGAPEPQKPSGFWESFNAKRPHPLDAIRDWYKKPEQLNAAFKALHVENQAKKEKRALTPEEQAIVERGNNAHLGLPDDSGTLLQATAGPAATAGGQALSGDVSGAAGTLAGGYGVPAAVGAAIPKLPAAGEAAMDAAEATGRAVKTGAKVVKGGVKGGLEAASDPKTMLGAGTAEFIGRSVGLPHGTGAALVAGPRIAKGIAKGAREALPPKQAPRFYGPRDVGWKDIPDVAAEEPPPFEPIRSDLPSGRKVGTGEAAPESEAPTPTAKPPLWKGIVRDAASEEPPEFTPIRGTLPSGRKVGIGQATPSAKEVPQESVPDPTALYEDIAKGFGRSYSRMNPTDKATVQKLADRITNGTEPPPMPARKSTAATQTPTATEAPPDYIANQHAASRLQLAGEMKDAMIRSFGAKAAPEQINTMPPKAWEYVEQLVDQKRGLPKGAPARVKDTSKETRAMAAQMYNEFVRNQQGLAAEMQPPPLIQ